MGCWAPGSAAPTRWDAGYHRGSHRGKHCAPRRPKALPFKGSHAGERGSQSGRISATFFLTVGDRRDLMASSSPGRTEILIGWLMRCSRVMHDHCSPPASNHSFIRQVQLVGPSGDSDPFSLPGTFRGAVVKTEHSVGAGASIPKPSSPPSEPMGQHSRSRRKNRFGPTPLRIQA